VATTIYPAKVALKAALIANTWPTTTPQISWGEPTRAEDVSPNGELIFLADVEVSDDFLTLGHSRLDETFALRVVIDVWKQGHDEQATEARAWVLRDEVVDLLRANPTLGGAINRITGFRARPASVPHSNGWRYQIVLDALCVGLEF
jgi:hypothetical protein